MTKILDSCALLRWMQEKGGAQVVHQLLEKASRGEENLFISAASIMEVYCSIYEKAGEEPAGTFFEDLKKRILPLEVVPVTNNRVWKAARLRYRYDLPVSEALTAHLAGDLKGTLITANPQFIKLEGKGIVDIQWLPDQE